MKKILLVALALCLSYGFAYSCLFNHSINLTTKMQNFETDSFTTKNGKSLKIIFFKHASLLIEYAGKKFFVDPVSDYADFTQQPKADYILRSTYPCFTIKIHGEMQSTLLYQDNILS